MIALDQLGHGNKPTSAQRRIPVVRLRFLVGKVHALGERPLYELFCEIVAGADIHLTLERYARLPAAFIAELGGDRLPSLRAVDRGQP
jgi:hypothetical protein